MSAYGSTAGGTPVLDALASRGVRFDQVQTAAPLTAPSHATILTGQYPPSHGVRGNVVFTLGGTHPTLAMRLKARGYRTAAFVGAYPVAAAFGFAQGFDPSIVVPVGTSKPELKAYVLEPGSRTAIAGVSVLALPLPHGDQLVFGYRIGAMAYLTDVKAIPESAIADLKDLEVLVLNALLSRPHPLHLSVPEAIAAAQRVGARRTFFTHLTHENTHAALEAMLPPGITPAYDGLVIDLAGP